jgi:hypothetical protein
MGDVVMMSGSSLGPSLIKGCLLLLILSAHALAKYSGGNGTREDPYRIASLTDLVQMGETQSDYNKHFLLTGDIDLASRPFTQAVIAPDRDHAKHSFQGRSFTGHLNGQGHTIRHLSIQGKDYLGLFGNLGSGAEVTNLGLVSVSVAGDRCVGALTGFSYLGRIASSYSTGMIRAGSHGGGLVGWNLHGTISRSFSICSVRGVSCIGGLVGANGGHVLNSYSGARIIGSDRVGGLIGANQSGHIGACFSMGSVRGETRSGGLIGMDTNGRILDSYWDIHASGLTVSAGGLVLDIAAAHDPNTYLDAGWRILAQGTTRLCDLWLSLDRDDTAWVADPGSTLAAPAGNVISANSMSPVDTGSLGTLWSSPATVTCLHSSLNLLEIALGVTLTSGIGSAPCILEACDESLGEGVSESVVSYLATAAVTGAATSNPDVRVPVHDSPAGMRRGDAKSASRRIGIDKGPYRDNHPTMAQVRSAWSSYCMSSIGDNRTQGGRRWSQIAGGSLNQTDTPYGVGFLDNLTGLSRFPSVSTHSWDTPGSILGEDMGAGGPVYMELSSIKNDPGLDWEFLDTFHYDTYRGVWMGEVETLFPKPYTRILPLHTTIAQP